MRRHAASIDAVAYLRGPRGFLRSAVQQMVRSTLCRLDLARLAPRYEAPVRIWSRALGAEPSLVPLDPSTLIGGEVVADFAARAGLDPIRPRPHANSSLSAESVAALFALRHRDGPGPSTGRAWRALPRLYAALEGFGARPFDFEEALYDAALGPRADDIAWIEARLGQPLHDPAPSGAVVIGRDDDLLDLAQGLGPALARHLARQGLWAQGDGRDVLGVMRGLVRRLGLGSPAALYLAPSPG